MFCFLKILQNAPNWAMPMFKGFIYYVKERWLLENIPKCKYYRISPRIKGLSCDGLPPIESFSIEACKTQRSSYHLSGLSDFYLLQRSQRKNGGQSLKASEYLFFPFTAEFSDRDNSTSSAYRLQGTEKQTESLVRIHLKSSAEWVGQPCPL